MKSTQGAGLIGDEALDFLAILSLPFLGLPIHVKQASLVMPDTS